jgi:hypothetical protein
MNGDSDTAVAYRLSKDAVTLSPDARDIARVSGLSEVEYARHV